MASIRRVGSVEWRWLALMETLFGWQRTIWITSTILEAEVISGRLLRVPGELPASERSWARRGWRALRIKCGARL